MRRCSMPNGLRTLKVSAGLTFRIARYIDRTFFGPTRAVSQIDSPCWSHSLNSHEHEVTCNALLVLLKYESIFPFLILLSIAAMLTSRNQSRGSVVASMIGAAYPMPAVALFDCHEFSLAQGKRRLSRQLYDFFPLLRRHRPDAETL